MTTLVKLTQAQLESVGYDVEIRDGEYGPIILFENDSILGFAFFFPNPRALIDGWRSESERAIKAFNLLSDAVKPNHGTLIFCFLQWRLGTLVRI